MHGANAFVGRFVHMGNFSCSRGHVVSLRTKWFKCKCARRVGSFYVKFTQNKEEQMIVLQIHTFELWAHFGRFCCTEIRVCTFDNNSICYSCAVEAAVFRRRRVGCGVV